MTTLDPRALTKEDDSLACPYCGGSGHKDDINPALSFLSQPQEGEPGTSRRCVGGECDWHRAHIVLEGSLRESQERCRKLESELDALARPQPALAVMGLHGPFGWLNGCRGLSEDGWSLESDPLENSEEYFAIPLYALTDPFKEIRPLYGRSDALASPPHSGEVEALRVTDAMVEAAAKTLWPSISTTWEEAYNSPPSSHNGYQVVYWLRQAKIALEAALSSAPATADGWKLVPVEPTVDMSAAGMRAVKAVQSDHFHKFAGGIANSIFEDMIAAAPTATGGR